MREKRPSEPIRQVAVVGAGTMGHGIAQVAALAGFSVNLFDVRSDLAHAGWERIRSTLDTAVTRGRVAPADRDRALEVIRPTSDLAEAVSPAQLIIEAAPENLETKCRLFSELGTLCSPRAILASNTSSLSISRIASHVARPERVIGLHFFNPPPVMKLIEIVRGERTSEETVEVALTVARRMGKEAIVVKDSPGFATSRLGLALGLEAIRMVEQGIASTEDIDRALELGYGHPMGPLRVSDLVGLDVRLAIAETLFQELGAEHFRPPALLLEKVRAGKLGKKTGEGFYRWPKS